MLVLAAVPDVQFHKLRRAAGSRFNVAQVSTWDDVLTSIRGRPVELAVVDPLLSGQARSQEIERLRVLFPSLPLMLYTTLTPRTAGVLLALGQRGIQHAVFANYDDHPSRLREVLGQEEARSARGWTGAPASGGSRGWGCRHPGTFSRRRGCCTPTACCRIPASRSRTWSRDPAASGGRTAPA